MKKNFAKQPIAGYTIGPNTLNQKCKIGKKNAVNVCISSIFYSWTRGALVNDEEC